jgi:formylglycine-generating enzyme required for sulfatase activity
LKLPGILALLIALLSACQNQPRDMVLIPAGEFKLGIDANDKLLSFVSDATANLNAQPLQNYRVDAFYIDIHEVTYEQFLQFKPKARYDEGKPGYPVQGISWFEADAYCLWAGKRLPTEFEWEKAARGADGRVFAWGNEFHREFANFGKTLQPVGAFEKDKSDQGVYDMNGNLAEWTASSYDPYPGSQHQDENYGKGLKVIRGGSFHKREHGFMTEFVMLTHRSFAPPGIRAWDTGFRCARSA